jgi:hypothetical protein
MMATRRLDRWVLLLLLVALPGCLAAAAGAGAGAGLYLTSRGAESLVDGSIDDVATRTQTALTDLGVQVTGTSTDKGGDVREFKGKKDDLDVTAHLERQGPSTTKVEVTARKNLAEWDKDFAKQVLQRIVQK